MKTCAYCGKENDDAALACPGCGRDIFQNPTEPPAFASQPSEAPEREQSLAEFVREVATDPTRLFRALVLLSTGTFVVWFLELYLFKRWIAPGTWDALAWRGHGARLLLPSGILWLWFLLWLAVAVGLWNFNKSARTVYALFTGFEILTSLLGGVAVQTPLGNGLSYISILSAGALLLMAYTTPLKAKFDS